MSKDFTYNEQYRELFENTKLSSNTFSGLIPSFDRYEHSRIMRDKKTLKKSTLERIKKDLEKSLLNTLKIIRDENTGTN